MDTPITFLATSREPAAPARRVLSRRFDFSAVTRVTVETRHPQLGAMLRGIVLRMRTQPGDGALSRWVAVDVDHVHHGPIVGDYLDAERVLLDATAALDEPVPAGPLAEGV
jgi:hypothetical protein